MIQLNEMGDLLQAGLSAGGLTQLSQSLLNSFCLVSVCLCQNNAGRSGVGGFMWWRVPNSNRFASI
jgi:hypothetical protein